MTRWRIWFAALALIGGALLMACGGGGDDDDDDGGNGGDEPTATESADGGEETPADGGNGDGDGNGDGSADISDLAGQWATKQAKITYDITSSDAAVGGTYTVYWNPPDEWRLDASSGGEEAGIFIKNADGTYVCSSDGSGGGQCISSPGMTIPVPFLGAFFDADEYENFVEGSFAGVDTDTSEETIAGMDANCYTVSSSVAGAEGEFEFCASDDGLPLRVRASAGGVDYTFEATSAEGSVADADFELPYEVLDLGG
jgi:hypothetical protein